MGLESKKPGQEGYDLTLPPSVIEKATGAPSNNPVINLVRYVRKRLLLILVVWGAMALGVHEINSCLEGKRVDAEEDFNFSDFSEDKKIEEFKKIKEFHEKVFLKENNLLHELESPSEDKQQPDEPENNPPDDNSDDDDEIPPPRRGIKISYA